MGTNHDEQVDREVADANAQANVRELVIRIATDDPNAEQIATAHATKIAEAMDFTGAYNWSVELVDVVEADSLAGWSNTSTWTEVSE